MRTGDDTVEKTTATLLCLLTGRVEDARPIRQNRPTTPAHSRYQIGERHAETKLIFVWANIAHHYDIEGLKTLLQRTPVGCIFRCRAIVLI